ncbi:Mfa1 family fimbria major subunit [Bacteroides sp. 224]|uniref:Mfa1 family fimbria major subunit n=1 Tax=Bacteroides sp. 224 TaxID=2302936 RepID=UPI001EF34B57|nr:Mfa1 family fimbria major subunit [Bacteroides sp. 224]
MAGFTSCSNDSDVEAPAPSEKGTATVDIKLNIPSTRGSSNYIGTSEESAIKEISVWIYDVKDGSTTVSHKKVANGASVTGIETTAGEKVIYVGANLPATIKGNITSAGKDLITSYVHNITMTDLANDVANNGIAMFAQTSLSANLVATPEGTTTTPNANKLTVKVERMVAKIAVAQKTDIVFATGFETTLDFTVKQTNRYIFTTKQETDPNYNGYLYSWNGTKSVIEAGATYGPEQFENSQNYLAVKAVADGADGDAWSANVNSFYVPENMEVLGRMGSNTYVSIRARYGTTTFWTINDATTNALKSIETSKPTAAADEVVYEYKDGYCYYRVYPIKETGYNVHRNDYYRVKINEIKGLGAPNDETEYTEDPDKEPDPFYPPGKPIDETNALVDVTVEVMNWVLFDEEEHVLGE